MLPRQEIFEILCGKKNFYKANSTQCCQVAQRDDKNKNIYDIKLHIQYIRKHFINFNEQSICTETKTNKALNKKHKQTAKAKYEKYK